MLGKLIFGCASQYSQAICVADTKDGGLAVQFDGEALSRAAITRMERVIATIEKQSGISRTQVGAFVTHQPNPRLGQFAREAVRRSAGAFPGGCAAPWESGVVHLRGRAEYSGRGGFQNGACGAETDFSSLAGTGLNFWGRVAGAS